MKVELVAYTPNPVETCGRAGGICHAKEEKEDYGAFVRRIVTLGHESVIEHAVFTFRVDGVSRALTHQWVRHRICSFSQRSQRMVNESEAGFVFPLMDYLDPVTQIEATYLMGESFKRSQSRYNHLLVLGVKKEDARYVLPNACETAMYWTVNARALRNFFKLRLSKHAQWEIRAMACKMFDLVWPIAGDLFWDLKELRMQNP